MYCCAAWQAVLDDRCDYRRPGERICREQVVVVTTGGAPRVWGRRGSEFDEDTKLLFLVDVVDNEVQTVLTRAGDGWFWWRRLCV